MKGEGRIYIEKVERGSGRGSDSGRDRDRGSDRERGRGRSRGIACMGAVAAEAAWPEWRCGSRTTLPCFDLCLH